MKTDWVFLLVFVGFSIKTEASLCEKMAAMAALEDGNTIVETNLKMLTGTWISEGCEIRPGPEYVIRSYTFEDDGRYFLVQHHYWDDSCSSPQLTVMSYGKIQIKPSFIQPGAMSGKFRITNITVIPQDENAAKELDRTVKVECPGQTWRSWRKYQEHTVYDNRYDENQKFYNLWMSAYNTQQITSKGNLHFADISCLGSLKWAFNELKLLKIQLRPVGEHMKKRLKDIKIELLLGDIHSNSNLRQFYMPTSFQIPLVKHVKEDTTVFVNRHSYNVKNTQSIPISMFNNPKTPPHLIEKPHLPPYIFGEWTSARCESRPMNLYLTRRFSFYSEDQTWIGEHKFFSDPFCTVPKFIVTAAGHFTLNNENKVLKGTTDIDFQIQRASLTVLDHKMIDDMRLNGLCGEDQWLVNVPKELSVTGGCIQLGIILPSIQYDIVKFEMDYKGACLLFLGQVDTDNLNFPSEENKRPTAFQTPLVKCGEVPSFSQSLSDILSQNVYYNSAKTAHISWFMSVSIVTFLISSLYFA